MSSRSPLGYQNAQIAYIKWHGTVSPLYAWSETSGCGEQFAYIVYVYVYMRAVSCFSHVPLFATLWAVACQAPLSMGFSKQEYWSRLPCPPLGDLSDSGIKPTSLVSPALAGGFFTACLVTQTVKDLPAMQETWVQSLGQEDLLQKGMVTHSGVLAWRILWTRGTWQVSPCGCKKSD